MKKGIPLPTDKEMKRFKELLEAGYLSVHHVESSEDIKPNPNIVAPENIAITEGWKPPKRNK